MNLLETATKLGIEGFLHCAELEKLAELATNRDVLEIGSYKGLSAWGMAITAKSLTCCDTFRAATNGQTQNETYTTLDDFLKAVTRFRNVSHFAGTSKDTFYVLTASFDMIFLDAMHTYEEVKADIDRWWPRVRPGGLMVGHDYGHAHFPGVKQAFDEKFGACEGDGNTPGTPWLVTLRWISKA